jgi:predicted ATP-binding protein involved in virulence
MKIRKLHIKNYKVFDDLELDFTDAQGNTLDKIVLAGVNGSGKTTILEIISRIIRYNSIDLDKNGYISLEAELTLQEKKKGDSHISNNVLKHIESPDEIRYYNDFLQSGLIFTFKFDEQNKIDIALLAILGFKKEYDTNLKLIYFPIQSNNNPEKDFFYKIVYLSSSKNEMKELALTDITDEVFKNEDITIRESKAKAIKRLQKPLNGLNLTTKLVDLASKELIFESPNGQRIHFEELSNGEQNLYFRAIYLSMLNPQNAIIMIDEPEDSLHPTWQQKVMQLYQNIGENNQVIVATHSPHIIGSSKAEEVFLLEIDENKIGAVHPRYTKGHSIDHILEVMGTNPRDTSVIKLVDDYLALMRKGLHETADGLKLKANIDALNLDPNSEEMLRLDLSMKRIKVLGV